MFINGWLVVVVMQCKVPQVECAHCFVQHWNYKNIYCIPHILTQPLEQIINMQYIVSRRVSHVQYVPIPMPFHWLNYCLKLLQCSSSLFLQRLADVISLQFVLVTMLLNHLQLAYQVYIPCGLQSINTVAPFMCLPTIGITLVDINSTYIWMLFCIQYYYRNFIWCFI